MVMPLLSSVNPNELSKDIKGGKVPTMGFVTGGLGVATAALRCFESVPPGVMAVKLRWGSEIRKHNSYFYTQVPGDRYGAKSKGPIFSLPGIERYVHITTRPDMEGDRLKPQLAQTNVGQWVRVGGSVVWHVMHDEDAVYRALGAVNNRKEVVPQIKTLVLESTSQALGQIMNGKSLEAMTDVDQRRMELIDKCTKSLFDIGVNLQNVYFDNPHYTEAEMQKQALIESAHIHACAQKEAAIESARLMAQAHRDAATKIAESISSCTPASQIGAAATFDVFSQFIDQQPEHSSSLPAIPLQILPDAS